VVVLRISKRVANLGGLVVLLSLPAYPQQIEGLLSTARSQMVNGRLAECQRTLDKILAANPRDTTALKLKADAYYLAGQDAGAEGSLLKAIAIAPRDPELRYALGRIYYQESRADAAAEQFHEVLKLNPASYKAYDNLGLCYQALRRDSEAIAAFLKALDLVHDAHREYEWPYANFASFLIDRGDYEKAFELAAEASARNPNSARNLYLTGKALVKLAKFDLSVRWLQRAAKVDPDYPEAHYLLARVYGELGRTEERKLELQRFQQILAKKPQNHR
jgi:tetratricopeptide (TPR) repeat protein